MALEISTLSAETARVRFTLPADDPPGRVSVVGSFNDWAPGLHELLDAGDGRRSVEVDAPYGRYLYFRYLGSDGAWFDEPDSDEVCAVGSVVYSLQADAPRLSADGVAPGGL